MVLWHARVCPALSIWAPQSCGAAASPRAMSELSIHTAGEQKPTPSPIALMDGCCRYPAAASCHHFFSYFSPQGGFLFGASHRSHQGVLAARHLLKARCPWPCHSSNSGVPPMDPTPLVAQASHTRAHLWVPSNISALPASACCGSFQVFCGVSS